MKKLLGFCISIFLITPLIANAITWTMDSSPFSFGDAGVKFQKQATTSNAVLKAFSNVSKGFVTIQFNLPKTEKNAKLCIYNLSGMQVASFNAVPGSNSIVWGVGGRTVAAGVYLAALRYGNVENRIQISIVK